jgi:hypothetical protein
MKFRNRLDQHLLEVTDIAMNIAAIGAKIDDWLSDQLAGTVIRHVSATS